jgi:hypothetical protein
LLLVVALVDWSPVVAVVELLEDWLPVVDVVALERDWSPVDVVLSMVTDERPRTSMLGVKTDEEPLRSFALLEVEPVTEELVLALEPMFEALDVVEEVVGAFTEGAEPIEAEEAAPLGASAAESGMQSMWTALAEFSLACPVSLPASLPACGFLRLLQSGLAAVAVVPGVALAVVALFAVALVVSAANAGVPSTAATARTLRNWERIMWVSPSFV